MAGLNCRIFHLPIEVPTFNWAHDSEHLRHLIRPAITFIQEARVRPALNLHQRPHVNIDDLNVEQRQVFNYVVDS